MEERMEPIVTQGLVIKEVNYGDYNKILTILSKDFGKLSAISYGARRQSSSKKSSSQFLSFSEYELVKSKSMYRIQQSEPLESFYKISCDLETLSFATYFADLANFFVPEGEICEPTLRLLMNTLYVLRENKYDPYLIKAVYELRLMCLAGYMPDLVGCRQCGENTKTMFLLPADGVLLCEKCKSFAPLNDTVALSMSVLEAFRYIVYCEDQKIFSFQISKLALSQLSKVCEDYAKTVFGDHMKSLRYLKDICMRNMDNGG